MKKSASALLIIAAICLSSCHDKKQLGNYVFVDGRKVVHADKDCDMVYRHSSLELCYHLPATSFAKKLTHIAAILANSGIYQHT